MVRPGNKLIRIYKKLYKYFGPQNWWPAENSFEVIIGAILTQNTKWANVEKAIANLKKEKYLIPQKLYNIKKSTLARLIRPSGYYNIKAKRLKSFIDFLFENYSGDIKKMFKKPVGQLRQELLEIKGIGPETADSILLYAGDKPVFVVDAYTKRIFSRHGIIGEDSGYQKIQDLFMAGLPKDTKLFNEYHALIVKLGKDFCLKTAPRCSDCPVK